MATKQKTGRITIANIIAIVGLVLLLVFSFLGHAYMSGGELGWDIFISVSITAITALLLWFLIKAKGAENNLDKWKKAEYATLVVYILFAILASLMGGIMHFFVVNDNKEEIKKYAHEDLQKIEEMFKEYSEYEATAISTTGTGLQTATMQGAICDESLNKFMEENRISHNRESAKNFENFQKNNLIGSDFEKFHDSFESQKNEIENIVNGWSVMQIPFKAKQIEDLAEAASKQLTALSNNATLPNIHASSYDGRFTIGDMQSKSFDIEGGIDSFKFRKALKNASGFSLVALFVVLLIHFLILFNYIVAYRTSTIGIGKDMEEDGGRIL